MFYKNQFSFENRCYETKRALRNYPDKAPIICEKSNASDKDVPDINNKKYLVALELSFGHFMYIIRKRMNLHHEEAIFLFIGNNIPTRSNTIGELYHKYKDIDGFLYVQYAKENTFGSSLC